MSSMVGARGLQGSTGTPKDQRLAGYDVKNVQQYTPEQMQLFQQMFQHVGPNSYTSRLASGDQSLFGEMEAPAMRQFSELQGGLASRFSGMGMGARRSSGFQNTMTSAASDFAQDLQSRRQELQRQAIQDLMGMSGNLLDKRPYQQFTQDKKKPWWQSFLGGALPLAGAGIGGMYGGIPGMTAGANIGSSAAQGFFS